MVNLLKRNKAIQGSQPIAPLTTEAVDALETITPADAQHLSENSAETASVDTDSTTPSQQEEMQRISELSNSLSEGLAARKRLKPIQRELKQLRNQHSEFLKQGRKHVQAMQDSDYALDELIAKFPAGHTKLFEQLLDTQAEHFMGQQYLAHYTLALESISDFKQREALHVSAEQLAAYQAFVAAYHQRQMLQSDIAKFHAEEAALQARYDSLATSMEEQLRLLQQFNISQEEINVLKRHKRIQGLISIGQKALPFIITAIVLGIFWPSMVGLAAGTLLYVFAGVFSGITLGITLYLKRSIKQFVAAYQVDAVDALRKSLLFRLYAYLIFSPFGKLAMIAMAATIFFAYPIFLGGALGLFGIFPLLGLAALAGWAAYKGSEALVTRLFGMQIKRTHDACVEVAIKGATIGISLAGKTLSGAFRAARWVISKLSSSPEKLARSALDDIAKALGKQKVILPVFGDKHVSPKRAQTNIVAAARSQWTLTSSPEHVLGADKTWLLRSNLKESLCAGLHEAIIKLSDSREPQDAALKQMLSLTLASIESTTDGSKQNAKITVELLALYRALTQYSLANGSTLAEAARTNPHVAIIMRELDAMLGLTPEARTAFEAHKHEHKAMLSTLKALAADLQAQIKEKGTMFGNRQDQLAIVNDMIAMLEKNAPEHDNPLSKKTYNDVVLLLTGETSHTGIVNKAARLRKGAQASQQSAAKDLHTATHDTLLDKLSAIDDVLQANAEAVMHTTSDLNAVKYTHYTINQAGEDIDTLSHLIADMQAEAGNTRKTWGQWLRRATATSDKAEEQDRFNQSVRATADYIAALDHDIAIIRETTEQMRPHIRKAQALILAQPGSIDINYVQAFLIDIIKKSREKVETLQDASARDMLKQMLDSAADAVSKLDTEHAFQAGSNLGDILEKATIFESSIVTLQQAQMSDDSRKLLVRMHILARNLDNLYSQMTPAEQAQHQHVKHFIDALNKVLRSNKGFSSESNRQAVLDAYQQLNASAVEGNVLLNFVRKALRMPAQQNPQAAVVVEELGKKDGIAKSRVLADVIDPEGQAIDHKAGKMMRIYEQTHQALQELLAVEEVVNQRLEGTRTSAELQTLIGNTRDLLAKIAHVRHTLDKREGVDFARLHDVQTDLQAKLVQQRGEIQIFMHKMQSELIESVKQSTTQKTKQPTLEDALAAQTLEEVLKQATPTIIRSA